MLILLVVVLFLLVILYFKLTQNYTYWKEKGVPQLDPIPFYGDSRKFFQNKISEPEQVLEHYKKFRKMGVPYGGIYKGSRKIWVPLDVELIKNILTKDFAHFNAHIPPLPKRLFFNNLFHMTGDPWKNMRRKLTPVFTTGKMKMMYETLLEKTYGLTTLVDKVANSEKPVEIKAMLARFTTDVIGSCGFGIECNSLTDEDSEFFHYGQKIFKTNKEKDSFIKHILSVLGFIRSPGQFDDIERFFRQVVANTLKYREENKVVRKDFIHLMLQLKNKGAITELTNINDDIYQKTVDKDGISLEDITGQVLFFFTAGFETSSTTMSLALLELTQNQDIQQKLREEVRKVLEKHNNKLTYDALQDMTYCEQVVEETLRMYPPLAILPRVCTQNYKIPGTDIVIEKGTSVQIPAWGIQRDPEYFDDPEKFDPDRFSAKNKQKIKPFTNMPFGDGPRQCLGLRFGLMQSKAGLAVLIKDYNFTLNKETPYPPKFNTKSFIPTVEGGIMLNATKVD